MPTNEEGEFELVLGNKQLLSVFFIIVVLLGVFFTMGYIVGRNTVPVATEVASVQGAANPIVVEPPAEGSAPADPSKPSPTGGAATAAKPEPAKAEPPAAEPAAAEPKPAAVAATKPSIPAGQAGPGVYLQVAATKKAEAELLAEILGKKGFPMATQPVPDSILIRVLVGPLADASAVANTRAALEAIGFKSFVRKI